MEISESESGKVVGKGVPLHGHFNFSFSPVNLQIVFAEPRVSKYQFLLA